VDPSLRSEGVDNSDSHYLREQGFAANDRLDFEFRMEFFNIFNRTQFAPPNTICCTAIIRTSGL